MTLEVIKEYEKLIYELRSIFPKARIVFLILFLGPIHVERPITESMYSLVFYQDIIICSIRTLLFVDKSGYLRHEFNGRNGALLNFRGKRGYS